MLFKSIVGIGAIAVSVGVAGCNRPGKRHATRPRTPRPRLPMPRPRLSGSVMPVTRLNERVAAVERDYAAKSEQLATGKKTATDGLREEVQEDVANVKQAVASLGTTTADNWWEREAEAMRRAADDLGSDVKRLAGTVETSSGRDGHAHHRAFHDPA